MIEGFSKLTKEQKIALLSLNKESEQILASATNNSEHISSVINELSENTISHFALPLGIVPNVLINGKTYFVPLVTEESSVVAAIAKAVKFWHPHGGFKTEVIGSLKMGHVHFFWKGSPELLKKKFDALKEFIQLRIASINRKMKKRNAGLQNIVLVDKTATLENYFQLEFSFKTADAMGANFINSCLEESSKALKQFISCDSKMNSDYLEVNMAILSNYTPESIARAQLSCKISNLNYYGDSLGITDYCNKFIRSVQIANADISRAVTNNKGIYNGVDSLAIATGNDWRAIEACGHAFASKNGNYKSLSKAWIKDDDFIFELEIPLAVGTVGGITNLHPIAKVSMQILNNPNADELMQLMAVCGLAANFSAINALITTGIQKGHMKMHLSNILKQLHASPKQIKLANMYFSNKTITFSVVEHWLKENN